MLMERKMSSAGVCVCAVWCDRKNDVHLSAWHMYELIAENVEIQYIVARVHKFVIDIFDITLLRVLRMSEY